MATLVTNRGLQIIADRLRGSGTEPKYIAWGTGTTAANVADTALETETAHESRTNGTSTTETETTASDTYQVVGTITVITSSKTISEAGLLDAATTGNMFVHSVFTGVPLDVGESIQFTFRVTFDQA